MQLGYIYIYPNLGHSSDKLLIVILVSYQEFTINASLKNTIHCSVFIKRPKI